MSSAAATTARSVRAASMELLFPMLLCASVLVIVAPLPAMLMDLLLAANITVSVLILLTTIFVRRPLEFSVFPAILLATTLVRLVLNVASTRLILSRGAIDGELAAGGVIRAFGDFVAGGQVLIGLVIFAIIVAIQFLVITKGATRISEVAARFALDGMSSRQTAIDADLSAGAISAQEARTKREELAQYADFYGAMDGASKFVRGDAIAGLLITMINIVGGLAIGVFQHGMDIFQACEVFTKLTIGDGLVTQIPAFLVSLAAGLIVTRGSTESQLSTDVMSQVFRHPEALGIAACFLVALSFTGLPVLPLLGLAVLCASLAWTTSGKPKPTAAVVEPLVGKSTQSDPKTVFEEQLTIHVLELELGFGLIRLTNASQGGDLLERVNRLRQKLVQEQGLILPSVHIRDNMRLKQFQYRIKLRDVPIAQGEAYPDRCLAVDTGDTTGAVQGIQGIDPAFQHPGVWIEPADREQAVQFGYRIVEATPVLIAHLNEIIRSHGDELLSQQQVHELLQRLKVHSPRVVEDVVPSLLTISQVHQVLMNLLRERVSIRPLESILETLAAHAARSQNVAELTEFVRIGLRRNISQQYRDPKNVLRAVALDPQLDDWLLGEVDQPERYSLNSTHSLRFAPPLVDALVQTFDAELAPLTSAGHHAVILCSSPLRPGLRQLLVPFLPSVVCLSLNEITADTRVHIQGRVSLEVVQNAAFAPI